MRVKNRVAHVSMENGIQGKITYIPFDSATITSNISSIPEARVITNHKILDGLKLKSGDEIYITSQVEKRESLEMKRAMYFIEKIIGDDIDKVSPKMSEDIEDRESELKDGERINYAGNIFSTAYSGQNRVAVGCIAFPFEYRRVKIPVVANYTRHSSILYRIGFLGYPFTYMANLLLAASHKDPLKRLELYLDELAAAGTKYMADPGILKKYRRHNLQRFSRVDYAHLGNIMKSFMTDNVKKFYQTTTMTEPDMLTMWNEILDIHDLEIVFCQYPIQTKNGNRGFMLVKPIFDEFEPSMCNCFFSDEVSNANYFKNEFREKTRVFMGFTLRDDPQQFPVAMCTAQAYEYGNKIAYELVTDRGELADYEKGLSREIIEAKIAFKYTPPEDLTEEIEAANNRGGVLVENNMSPKLKLTNLERRKGVFPMVVSADIHSVNKVQQDYGEIALTQEQRDLRNAGTFEDNKETEDFWKDGSVEIATKLLTIQKIQDSIFGERNSSIETFFAPYVIPGLSGGFKFDDVGYYGKVTGVVTSITPNMVSSSVSFIRVIRDQEDILSTYYSFKDKSSGVGLLREIDPLKEEGIRTKENVNPEKLNMYHEDKEVDQNWFSANRFKNALDEKRKEMDCFEEMYFAKCKTMPVFTTYLKGLKS